MEEKRDLVTRVINSRFWRVLLVMQKAVMLFTTVTMLAILGAVVFTRYVFHVDFYGYDEIVLVSAFWMYFIGASYGMSKEEHVKADIISMMLSIRQRAFCKALSGVVQAVLNIAVTVLALQMILRSIETWPITTLWNIPYIIPQTALLTGFLITGFYLCVFALRDIGQYLALKRR